MKKAFQWKPFIALVSSIAIPVAIQNLLATTGSMVDTMMLATLGQNYVGAVGLCAQFSTLLFSGYWGFIGGGILFMSQFWGARDFDGIRRSYGITLTFVMTVGILFNLFTGCFPSMIMNIYTNKPEIQEIGIQYLRYVGFSYPLQTLAITMSALLRSTEKIKIPLYAGILSVLSNCFFNYVFIFGQFGMPALGVTGAALGTFLSQFVNVSVIILLSWRKHIPFVLEFSKLFHWNKGFIRNYMQKCFPIICNEVAMGVSNMLINIVLGRQSTAAIAAVAVYRTIEGLIISFFSGFSNAASILIGKEVGAGAHEVAYEREKRLVYLCQGIVALVCVSVMLLHQPLFTAMGLQGEAFDICAQITLIYCIFAVIRMGNWVQNDSFRSAGDPAYGTILEISFMYLLVLPVVYLSNFVFHAPFLLVFALIFIDEPIRYILMQKHVYSGKWVQPVSAEGLATIEEFRKKHHIIKTS